MMKWLLYIITGLCLGMNARAQSYFNVRETLNSFSVQLTSVVEQQGKYYTAGICWDSINYIGGTSAYQVIGIRFSVFDQSGNKLKDTFYQRQDRDIFASYGKLLPQPDGSFLLAVDAVEPGANAKFFLTLYRFDSLGSMLMEKDYLKPVCTGLNPSSDLWRLTDFKPDGYGNWLMLSTISCRWLSNVHADILLTKLDSNFNVIWHKQYGDPTGKHDVAAKLLVDTGGYVLSGGLDNVNWVDKNFIFQAQLIRTDTAGNVQWTYLSPANRLTNTIQDVIRTQDGGYVYCGQGDGYEELAPDGIHGNISWKGWVEKIDANRNTVWTKTISALRTGIATNEQRILKLMPDETIVVGGMVYGGFDPGDTVLKYNYGSLVKIDKKGNTVWQKKYAFPNDTLLYYIYDMKQTSDSGFILCGEATDRYYPYNDPTQRAWLIKVDSNGCMGPTDPQCHPTSTGPELGAPAAVQLYPNPVSGTLFIRSAAREELSFLLYDLMGRKVREQQLHTGINAVPIQTLPAGVYVYKLADGKGVVQQGKLIKE